MLIGGEMRAMSFGPEEDWQATRAFAARPAMIRRGVMVNLLLQTDMNR